MSKVPEPAAERKPGGGDSGRSAGRPSVQGERQRQIIDAAVEVILERGIAGASRARIAERAAVQPSAIHHFVGTQDDVLRAAIDDIAVRLRSGLDDGEMPGAADDALLFRIDLLFGHAVDTPQVNQLIDELVAHSYRDRPTRDALATFYRDATTELGNEFTRRSGDTDPAPGAAAAAPVIGLVHAAGTFRHLGLDDLAAAAHRLARTLAVSD